jgi:molecular chaperone GrpE (heat shock protein)
MADHLLKALLSVVAMLEDAVKFGMDSHAAVNALEGLAFELDQMSDSERAEFMEAINRIADSADPAQREWIRNLPGNLGI